MAFFPCNVCGVQRPVHKKSWMRSQVDNITQNGSPVVGFYNCCRQCSPCCWIDPPLPEGASPPNLCIVCREIREVHRQHWMPSQMRSIWSLHTSVTDEYNCCRSCDPACWVPIWGRSAPPSQNPRPTKPTPTWKRQCANDCRGGAPVSFQIPLWALRQLLLAMAAATYVVNGSITTTPPISSKIQIHPSFWMLATAYTNNFCCRCGPVHSYGIPIRIKSISATSSRRFLVLSSSTGPTPFRPAPPTLASPTTAPWSYSKLYQEFALQHFAIPECSAVAHFVEFDGL